MQILKELVEIDFSKLEKNVVDFINIELMKCRKNKIIPYIPRRKSIKHSGMPCAGYFDEKDHVLAVSYSGSKHKWLSTLIHETCHMDQYLEGTDVWTANVNGQDALEIIDEWLLGNNDPDHDTLQKAFDITTYIELDCEKRSLEKILKYNLPINKTVYIKKSNAYVWSYRLMHQTRQWEHSGAYEFSKVWREMPGHFDNDYAVLPDSISQIFYANIELFSNITK